jgi:hydroxyquinol 1,2-dioxygenase
MTDLTIDRDTGSQQPSLPEITTENLTGMVVASFDACPDPRMKEVMTSLTRHLHDFLKEVRPTDQEWTNAVEFITEAGQISGPHRQEVLLLSDVLGCSILLDIMNHSAGKGATETNLFSPWYIPDARPIENGGSLIRDESKATVLFQGKVTGQDGEPIPNAKIEIWLAEPDQEYDVQHGDDAPIDYRGTFHTAPDGSYSFKGALPPNYPIPTDGPVGKLLTLTNRNVWRPAHVHYMVHADGYRTLNTQVYFTGDKYFENDAIFASKPSLILDPKPRDGGMMEVTFDIGLAKL